MVHFFLYDYKFNCIWQNPDQFIDRIKNYRAVLSPDFSIYLETNPTIQLYNVFRSRWCGAFWASKGIRAIPSVSWGDERTFLFFFVFLEYQREVLLQYLLTWFQSTTIVATKRSSF